MWTNPLVLSDSRTPLLFSFSLPCSSCEKVRFVSTFWGSVQSIFLAMRLWLKTFFFSGKRNLIENRPYQLNRVRSDHEMYRRRIIWRWSCGLCVCRAPFLSISGVAFSGNLLYSTASEISNCMEEKPSMPPCPHLLHWEKVRKVAPRIYPKIDSALHKEIIRSRDICPKFSEAECAIFKPLHQ